MGRKIRQGNDVPVEWTLLDAGGNPYIVEGKNFAVDLVVGSRKFRMSGVTATGNVINFTFFGKDQKSTGDVVLIYTENAGQEGMVTYDVNDSFSLVPHSWQAVDPDEEPETVTIETVQLASTLSVGSPSSCPMERGEGENSAQQKGSGAEATGEGAFAEGDGVASGDYSHAEGYGTESFAHYSHAEGLDTTADGEQSHAEGGSTIASGDYSHAEGNTTQATALHAHSEGWQTVASEANAHAEGRQTTSSGNASHAEGRSTTASEQNAHAEGYQSTASGANAHAEGYLTQATGHSAHAEGRQSVASGNYTHAEGRGTQATNEGEHAEGKFNAHHDDTIHSIGIGTSANDRKNAVEVTTDGREFVLGVGGYNGTNSDEAKPLAEVLMELAGVFQMTAIPPSGNYTNEQLDEFFDLTEFNKIKDGGYKFASIGNADNDICPVAYCHPKVCILTLDGVYAIRIVKGKNQGVTFYVVTTTLSPFGAAQPY